MLITEVRVWPAEPTPSNLRIRGYAEVVYDGSLRVADLRIVQGDGRLHVAMPSRPRRTTCRGCGRKTAVMYPHCGWCGLAASPRPEGPYYQDLVAPICRAARGYLEEVVLSAYRDVVAAKQHGVEDGGSYAVPDDLEARYDHLEVIYP